MREVSGFHPSRSLGLIKRKGQRKAPNLKGTGPTAMQYQTVKLEHHKLTVNNSLPKRCRASDIFFL